MVTAAAVLLSFFLRLPFYLGRQVFNVDEGTLAAVASTILDGGVPYRDSWDTRGPVTFYLYAAVFALFGRYNMLAVHLMLILTVCLSSLLLSLIGRAMGRSRAGDAAALLYAVITTTYWELDMMAANIELFMVFFILGGAWFFLKGIRGGSRRAFFGAGLAMGLAFLTKQPAILDLAGMILFLVFFPTRAGFDRRRRLGAALLAGAGFALPVAVTVGLFTRAGALPEFFFGFWSYYADYFMPAVSTATRLRMAWEGPRFLIRDNVFAWAMAAVMMAVIAVTLARRRGRLRPADFPAVWAVTSFAAASGSGRGFGHYYIQVLAPIALLTGLFLAGVLPRLVRRADLMLAAGRRPALSRRSLTAVVLAASVVGSAAPLIKYQEPRQWPLLAGVPALLGMSPAERNLAGTGPGMRELVTAIRAGSRPDEGIFVWGFYPQIYIVADRKPATRFSYCIYLTGLIPWVNVNPGRDTGRFIVPGSWDLLMSDLERNRPVYIVDTAPSGFSYWGKYPMSKYPRLREYVADHYRLEANIPLRRGSIDLYRRIGD
jgi:4-amino-4-deoxy-L-arabinose transferase-like glycosyltransferase